MRVGLIDVDSKMINLALLKLSTYHKKMGDTVEWYSPLYGMYDRIYMSKIFNFTSDYKYELKANEVIKGGTGYDVKSFLPENVDNCQPDYSIYPDCKYSIQFFSRGCIRKCKFCVVHEKEGYIHSVEPMNLNPNGECIEIFDNNFFANPNWKEAIHYLLRVGQPVKFSQGIDIRIIKDEQAKMLSKLKRGGLKRGKWGNKKNNNKIIPKCVHIAWDNPKENIDKGIEIITRYIKAERITCYVLIGYNTTHEENYFRVMKLRGIGIEPFVMPYDKHDDYQKRFARWVNHKAIFKTVKWEDYKKKDTFEKVYNSNILEYT